MHFPDHFLQEQLALQLRAVLGDIDPTALELLRQQLVWVEVPAGAVLMRQGEPGDSMYISVTGRMRVVRREDDGSERVIREMKRGQIIGELSLYTQEPRSATVVAVRDSWVVRLDRSGFEALLSGSAKASMALTRQVILRLQSGVSRANVAPPVVMGLVPVSAGVEAQLVAQRLAQQMGRSARVCLVTSQSLERELGIAGIAQAEESDAASHQQVSRHLDELEAAHDVVLLLADDAPGAWTRRCSRRCDEILLLADASAEPVLHANEIECLMSRQGMAAAAEVLVLLHPKDQRSPQGTRRWLDRRPVADFVHIRPELERDIARLARIQSRTAVGFVLGGGGARGCAHLGMYQAMQEQGIEVDFVGGTSIGAIMASLIASDQPARALIDQARGFFGRNPTGDFNLMPVLSLIAGKRIRMLIDRALLALFGQAPDVEDLWKNCFCMVSNFSQAREQVMDRGPLATAMLASSAIPGALPPVIHDGDLLCDGGTFNNFPVDVMRARRGVGQVIGVDLSVRKVRRITLQSMPSNFALLMDRLRPRAQRRFKLPSLASYLMNVTILYGASRTEESRRLSDLYVNPPLPRVGLLQWDRFDSIVAEGLEHGREVLAATPPQALAAMRGER